jgi:small conductance mechanosensitive channel
MDVIIEKMQTLLAEYGLDIIAAILILVIGRYVSKLTAKIIEKAMQKARVDETLAGFTSGLCYMGLMVIVIISALAKIGVPTTSFIAIIGAAGLAIGFALQGSLSNFAAGIILIIFKPFKVGDLVEIGGKIGTVSEIQIFSTIINAPDNVQVIIPNAQVTGAEIMNYTVNGTRRVDLVIGVSYDDDLKKAELVINSVLTEDGRVLAEPEPTVAVSELADSSVNFVVRPWVRSDEYWDVYFDLTGKIKVALDDHGITIPYPQRDLHMIQQAPDSGL